ncbi:unnamed protein product, partial [Thlaspi arvense]
MSATDIVTIPASANYVTFDDLRLGRSTQQIVGRLLRYWDARNIKKNGEFMGIVLLILDEKGFIPAGRADQFRPLLREDAVFNIGIFEVGRCTNLYKITDHPFVIRFLPATTIVEIHHVSPTIKHERFMIRNIDHLQALANTNLELPDVVGQIQFVQGSNLDDPTSTQRLVVCFRVDTSVVVYLSLWDDAAATFWAHLTTGDTMHSVMVVTTINPKLFGGNLYLNSTPATIFYFDSNIHAIQQLTTRMGIQAIEPFVQTETKNGIRKKESVSIAELHDFISKSNEQTQEADFVCKARVVGVLQRNGWSYISCAACSRKLSRSGTDLKCNKCVSQKVTGVPRYRVELAVDDGEDSATFLVFDSEMIKITNKPASTLILEQICIPKRELHLPHIRRVQYRHPKNKSADGANGNELPACLQAMADKHFIFQIRVTPYNFTPTHRTFTVSTMTHDTIFGDGDDHILQTKMTPGKGHKHRGRKSTGRT